MPYTEMCDEELASLLRDTEHDNPVWGEAGGEFYRRLRPKVLGYVRKKWKNNLGDLPESIADQILEDFVLTKLKKYKSNHPFYPFFWNAVRWNIVDRYRQRCRKISCTGSIEEMEKTEIFQDKTEQEEIRQRMTDEIQEETCRRISKAINEIPNQEQQTVLKLYLEDYSYGEIAKRMQSNYNTVRLIFHRATEALKEILVTH